MSLSIVRRNRVAAQCVRPNPKCVMAPVQLIDVMKIVAASERLETSMANVPSIWRKLPYTFRILFATESKCSFRYQKTCGTCTRINDKQVVTDTRMSEASYHTTVTNAREFGWESELRFDCWGPQQPILVVGTSQRRIHRFFYLGGITPKRNRSEGCNMQRYQ